MTIEIKRIGLHADLPGYVQKVATLARAERAGLLVDCDGADAAAVAWGAPVRQSLPRVATP